VAHCPKAEVLIVVVVVVVIVVVVVVVVYYVVVVWCIQGTAGAAATEGCGALSQG